LTFQCLQGQLGTILVTALRDGGRNCHPVFIQFALGPGQDEAMILLLNPDRVSEKKAGASAKLSRLSCWNWKCALMSAVVRSVVYGLAMTRNGLAVIAVEMLYVTLTAGLYAGLQQRALELRRRWLGDLAIVLGVPALSQVVDWLLHRVMGAPAPHRALVSVCVFTLISALFHRHVMRQGTFLTGAQGKSLKEDFQRVPRLVLSFAVSPGILLRSLPVRMGRASDAKLAA